MSCSTFKTIIIVVTSNAITLLLIWMYINNIFHYIKLRNKVTIISHDNIKEFNLRRISYSIDSLRRYVGIGNFMEIYYYNIAKYCADDSIRYYTTTNKTKHKFKYFGELLILMPIHEDDMLYICSELKHKLITTNSWEYYTNMTKDVYKKSRISNTRSSEWYPKVNDLVITFDNTPFINIIGKHLNRSFNKYYETRKNENNFIIYECDIGIHIRLGDLLNTPNPLKGIYTSVFFKDAVEMLLNSKPYCANIDTQNKTIYIVTQISKNAVRSSNNYNYYHDLANQIINIISQELSIKYSKKGYNIKIISTNTIDDWNLLRRIKNLICTASSFCHAAAVGNIYGTNGIQIFPNFLDSWHFIDLKTKYNNIYPYNRHLIKYDKKYGILCSAMNSLKWNTPQLQHKLLNYIKTGDMSQ